jgi:hypothetical protein
MLSCSFSATFSEGLLLGHPSLVLLDLSDHSKPSRQNGFF